MMAASTTKTMTDQHTTGIVKVIAFILIRTANVIINNLGSDTIAPKLNTIYTTIIMRSIFQTIKHLNGAARALKSAAEIQEIILLLKEIEANANLEKNENPTQNIHDELSPRK